MNCAYYIPVGLMGELTGWPGRTTAVTAAGLSALTEIIQVFSRDQDAALTDVMLNTAGRDGGSRADQESHKVPAQKVKGTRPGNIR